MKDKLDKLKETKEVINSLTIEDIRNQEVINYLSEIRGVIADFFSMIKTRHKPLNLRQNEK